jgi:flavin reductase (DIM6/NTAB) family NADH-FMN oxidoreductase RutF
MSTDTLERPVDLRRFAGRFPTGVAVITTRDTHGKCHGITMSALTSLSLDPPLFLICLNNTSKTLGAIKSSGRLCINFLSAEQIDVSKTFASKDDDKFREVRHTLGELGSPVIDGAVANGECIVETSHEGGDHTIVIARVVRTLVNPGEPLVYHAGKFTSLATCEPA